MDTSKRNSIVGLAGIALLLVSVLAYAQVNAARNYELPDDQTGPPSPGVTVTH